MVSSTTRSRISRRGLIGSGVAASMLAATGFPVRAQPQRGGRLRLALPGARASDSFDTRTGVDLFMLVAGSGAVFDTLTEIGPDGLLRGELATAWTANAEARSWTVTLREGVTFHNGKPFAAEDVIASLKVHRTAQSPAWPLMQQVRSMRRVGRHVVRFDLHQPNADFPYLLSDHHLLIYPAGQIDEAMKSGIGTGLYRVERFVPGERLHLQRVGSHYKDGRAGWFDALDIVALDDPGLRLEALRAGQIDVIPDVAGAEAATLKARGLQPVSTQGNGHIAFTMRMDAGPFADPRVRLALKHAVDRPAMLRDAFGGDGVIGADHPVGPLNPFVSDIAPLPYDPAYAAHLLRKAGYDSLTLPIAAPAGLDAVVRSYADAARPAGIDIVRSDEGDDSPWLAVDWAGRPTEDWMLSTGMVEGSVLNAGRWSDPHLSQLLQHARGTLDAGHRTTLYAEAQRLVAEEGNVVIPVFPAFTAALRPNIGRPDTLGATHRLDDARLAERWWKV